MVTRKPSKSHVANFDIGLANTVSTKLEEGNFKGAVCLLCSEDRPVSHSDDIVAALNRKHPSVP